MSVETIELVGSAAIGLVPPPAGLMETVALPTTVKLGRRKPTAAQRARQLLKLGDYLSDEFLKALPDTLDWTAKANASLGRMYLNDQYGDCVIAGKYHTVGVWSGNDTPTSLVGTDSEVYATYQKFCGPGDNGCVITDVLDRMKSAGIPLNGVAHKIDGYVGIDWTNQQIVKAALFLFGNITLGINLPQAWTTDATWDVTNTQIVGGHDVSAFGFSPAGVTISSWGRKYLVTWAALAKNRPWFEEAYTLLGVDWYNADNLSPNNFDTTTLKADLTKIGGGTVPPVDPPGPIPPTPIPPTPIPPTPIPGSTSGYRVASAPNFTALQTVVNTNLADGWTCEGGYFKDSSGSYQAMTKPATAMHAAALAVSVADVRKLLVEAITILTGLVGTYPKLQYVIIVLNFVLALLPAS